MAFYFTDLINEIKVLYGLDFEITTTNTSHFKKPLIPKSTKQLLQLSQNLNIDLGLLIFEGEKEFFMSQELKIMQLIDDIVKINEQGINKVMEYTQILISSEKYSIKITNLTWFKDSKI